jgi:hypothetical protein
MTELVNCSSGMVWMQFNVDVDSSGGGEGKGSRMKGKKKQEFVVG